MIAQFASPITTICFNRVILSRIGEGGVNAYAIIANISALAMSLLYGASEGIQP